MNKLVLTTVCCFLAALVFGQDFSNRGRDFWVGYGYHQSMVGNNSQDMILYLSADSAATVTVSIPRLSWSRTYTVPANTVVQSDNIPKTGTQDATLKTEGISDKGIHITSDKPIVAYAHIYNQNVSGASLLFPVNTLGQDYYSLNYTQNSNSPNSNSWAYVIATEDNTTVEITPSAATLSHAAGTPFTVNLNQGQVYNLMGTATTSSPPYRGSDLTGTRIRSISNTSGSCKKIAVFSGSGRMSIFCGAANATSSDNFIQQVFPRVAWGKKYLTVPTKGLTNNIFRVAVSDPSTVVTVDGVVQTGLIANFYYEFSSNVPKSIVADKPVMVAQYITSTNSGAGPTCGNTYGNNGDPEMIYLSPTEQTIDTISVYSTPRYSISEHCINVVIKTSDVASFTLDGSARVSSFNVHPKDAAYSYATFTVSQGQHKLQAAGGFNAIAYGYGQYESYGYNAGTNIKDLYTYISLQNQFQTLSTPTTCVNTNFLFAITFPYQPSSITWDFSGASASLSPSSNVVINSPVADSTFIKDGRTLYVYKIPGSYTFTTAGSFPIKIVTVNPSSDGCSGQQELTYFAQVEQLPQVNFTYTHTGCITDSVYFTDATNDFGRPLVKWNWDFGDATTDGRQNPGKQYTTPNTYNVKLTTVNNLGCANSTVKPVVIQPTPVAKFGMSSPICIGVPVRFTDSSTIAVGNIAKWRWAFGPGDSVINSTNAPVTRTFAGAGPYTVTLIVENAAGCKSAPYTLTFTADATPVPDFSMPGVCLPVGNAQFTNLSSITGGTLASMTYSWSFGDGGTSGTTNPLHVYSIAGPFNVKLTATSLNGCTKDTVKVVNNVYAQPKAGFRVAPVSACTGDSLTFTDTSRATGSSVSQWFWSFSDGSVSSLQNPGKKFPGLDTVVATLYIQSAAGCYSDTIRRLIPFNKRPTAAFTTTGTTCQGQTFTINNQSVANTGSITNWSWNFGNGVAANYNNGNPFTFKFDTVNTYTIKLVVTTDRGCKSDTAKLNLNIIPAPTVAFSLPVVCQNDPAAVFINNSSIVGGGALTYLWNFGDAGATPSNPNTSTAKDGQHQYTAAQTYTVTLQVGTITGCSSTLSQQFTVNAVPVTDFSFVKKDSLCAGDVVQIINKSTIPVGNIRRCEIIWDSVNAPLIKDIDTLPTNGKIYKHTYPALSSNATYKIVLRSFSGQSCISEKVSTITIGASPNAVFSPVNDFCITDAGVNLSAAETFGLAGAGVFSGAGVTAGGFFTPSQAGVGQHLLTYTFTSSNGCADTALRNVKVEANPVITLPRILYVLEGSSFALNPTLTANATNFTWFPSTYLSSASVARPTLLPKNDISYKFVASTAGGCSDSATIDIVVLSEPKVPNAFSPNGDGVNDYWQIASLASYPGCVVEVYNRLGQKVYSSIGYRTPWNGTYNGSPLPVGVYYYIINPGNGRKLFTGNVTLLR